MGGGDSLSTWDTVDATVSLAGRGDRAGDPRATLDAVRALARVMASDPSGASRALADRALTLCRAGSAGVSLCAPDGSERWDAVAGALAAHSGLRIPPDGPAADCLRRGGPRLYDRPARASAGLAGVAPEVRELLAVPIESAGLAVGAVWVASHDDAAAFSAADAEALQSLADVAAPVLAAALPAADFRKLAEGLPEIVWATRPDGWHEYYNRRWYEYTGLTPAESLGHGWSIPLHPDDRARAQACWAEATGGGTPYETEYRFRSATGGYRWFLARALPSFDDQGRAVRWFGTCTDIDDRKRAGAERVRLLDRERRRSDDLRTLADVSTRLNQAGDVGAILGVMTEEARRLLHARQATACLTADANGGRPVECVAYADDGGDRHGCGGPAEPSAVEALARLVRRPVRLSAAELSAAPSWSVLACGADGRPPRSGWLAVPMRGRDGRTVGVVALSDKDGGAFTGDDESMLVQLAQTAAVALGNAWLYRQLLDNDRRKNDFLAMLAHELRNPLGAVRNAVGVLQAEPADEDRAWAAGVVVRQVGHLARLVDDLLDVSRINRGRIDLRTERLDAAHVVAAASESARPLVEGRGHRFSAHAPHDTHWVVADPTRLEQVLVNLISNAAKYTEAGGSVALTLGREGDEVVIRVQDSGIGIPAELLPRVFELFSQGDRTLARSEGGLGVGLTLVKRLVELHGGSVAALSEGPGKGSEFVVRLPAAPPEREAPGPKAAAKTEPTRAAKGRGRGARVLIVDDNVDLARGIGRLLKVLGHESRLAHDGPSALVAAREFRPAFVLLDIGLPGMDGYQVAARLRQDDDLRGAVIIAVTGYGQDDDLRRSREAGIDHHLVKPVDHDTLVSLLSDLPGPN